MKKIVYLKDRTATPSELPSRHQKKGDFYHYGFDTSDTLLRELNDVLFRIRRLPANELDLSLRAANFVAGLTVGQIEKKSGAQFLAAGATYKMVNEYKRELARFGLTLKGS